MRILIISRVNARVESIGIFARRVELPIEERFSIEKETRVDERSKYLEFTR